MGCLKRTWMRIARIRCLPIVGLLVLLSACSNPVPVVPATPVPVTLPPVKSPPEVITTAAPPPLAPEQTVFIVSELAMNPAAVMLGDNVVVSVKVTNTGKERGAYTVVVKFNGKTVKTQDIVLDAGVGGKADLSVVAEFPGEYRVEVGQLTGILKVVAQ